jgi:hypothetical protein
LLAFAGLFFVSLLPFFVSFLLFLCAFLCAFGFFLYASICLALELSLLAREALLDDLLVLLPQALIQREFPLAVYTLNVCLSFLAVWTLNLCMSLHTNLYGDRGTKFADFPS